MNESLESIKLIQQLFPIISINTSLCKLIISGILHNCDNLIMESMIYSFINNYISLKLFLYVRQEGPKGELGVIISTNNINKLYRLKIRSPD